MPDAPQPIDLDAQVTPAHVLDVLVQFKSEVNARFDTLTGDVAELKDTVKEAGLNGHTPYLKAFLEQYAATYTTRQAWLTVRGDIAHKLRWIATPKGWLKMLGAALIGGIGWKLASTLPQIPPIHIP